MQQVKISEVRGPYAAADVIHNLSVDTTDGRFIEPGKGPTRTLCIALTLAASSG